MSLKKKDKLAQARTRQEVGTSNISGEPGPSIEKEPHMLY